MNILLIEDEGDWLTVFQTGLEQKNHTVTGVANLLYAEELLCGQAKGKPYDVIFLDLYMSIEDLPEEYHEYALDTFAGWAFYEKVMPPVLHDRTIFLTAFGDELERKLKAEDPKARRKLNVLVKKGENTIENALRIAEKIMRK